MAPRAALALGVLLGVALLTPLGGQDQQRPPTFKSGTNIIRVDATVTDRSGNPLITLTADDFEIREDGKLQPISSFKFISADGQPTDDRSLPIRSQSHAAAEAARDDVRTFLILWDEYHIDQFAGALRGREALSKAILTEFGPTDLVAVMDQLTPISAIEFTRDRRALADRVHLLQGRLGQYLPPRSAVEEAHMQAQRRPGDIEIFRTQVTVTAIKAAAAHLGTLGAGRKTLIIVTQSLGGMVPRSGIMMPAMLRSAAQIGPRDIENMAIDIVRAANDSNAAVHVIDPRGLQVNSSVFGGPLDTIASGTGGELHKSNDAVSAFRQMVRQVSALYLLGYTREMPTDGRFHEIKVRVKRGGVDVRARAGYWAPRAEDIEDAKRKAAAAELPPPVRDAFATLVPSGAPRLVDLWAGNTPLPDGRVQLRLAWAPRGTADSAGAPLSVAVTGRSGATDLFDKPIEPGGTAFAAPAGEVQLAIRVMSKNGEVLDRESRTIVLGPGAADALTFSTPAVYRSRSPAELRAIQGSETAPLYAGREFVRTDRLVIRTSIHGGLAASAKVSARLIDRRGATLVLLPVRPSSAGTGFELDLPLTSIAAGEFAVAFEAASGDTRTEALVAFKVLR